MNDCILLRPILTGARPQTSGRGGQLVLGERHADGWKPAGGGIVVSPQGEPSVTGPATAAPPGSTFLLRFRCLGRTDNESDKTFAVALVPAAPGVLVQGRSIIAIRVVRPGDVVSLGEAGEYLVVRRYQPSREIVPPRLAEKACGVCGMPLKLSRVAACACGTFYHAEAPEDLAPPSVAGGPDDDVLRCFTHPPRCITCQEEKTYEPKLIPDPASLGFGGMR